MSGSIGRIAQGITIEGPDGRPVRGVILDRAQRRNIARRMHRQQKPPKISVEANANFLGAVAQRRAMMEQLVSERAALEVEMETSYMEAAKLR